MVTTSWLSVWLDEYVCVRCVNPIAVAMDQAVVRKCERLSNYCSMLSEENGQDVVCEMMRAGVQRLILDMQGQSEIMDEWMDAIICRYFYGNSWSQMYRCGCKV